MALTAVGSGADPLAVDLSGKSAVNYLLEDLDVTDPDAVARAVQASMALLVAGLNPGDCVPGGESAMETAVRFECPELIELFSVYQRDTAAEVSMIGGCLQGTIRMAVQDAHIKRLAAVMPKDGAWWRMVNGDTAKLSMVPAIEPVDESTYSYGGFLPEYK